MKAFHLSSLSLYTGGGGNQGGGGNSPSGYNTFGRREGLFWDALRPFWPVPFWEEGWI